MKVHRDDIVAGLRDIGRAEEAERAMAELPERVDVRQHEQKLHRYRLPFPYASHDLLSRGGLRYGPIDGRGDGGM
jgi:hypothetical protein